MASVVIMPRQGQSVESCIIAKWYKKKGDQVQIGDPLFNYETDKATFDEEAKVEGILLDIFFEEGDDVPVLTNVCVIGEAGEDVSSFRPGAEEDDQGQAEAKKEESDHPTKEETEERAALTLLADEGKIKISPRAKNLADRMGLDYRYAAASGPYGRIIERDILALQEKGPYVTAAARAEAFQIEGLPGEGTGIGGRMTTRDLQQRPVEPTAAAAAAVAVAPMTDEGQAADRGYTELPLSNIRKVIARAMHQSLTSTAQLTLHASFDASELLDFRKKLKARGAAMTLENITLNDMVLFAVSRTLPGHPELNAHLVEDKMLLFKNVQLGVAVDTPRGLMVPTIANANLMSLNEIARQSKALAQDCQSGTINPDLLKGGSFTVTNLGTLDVEYFTPVLNPPQTGILGVGTIVQRAREVDGDMVFYPAMGLSLTFDHRAVDGAPAARFLKDLKTNLENFSMLMAK